MKAVRITADWSPRMGYILTKKDTKPTYTGNANQVMCNPKWSLEDVPNPSITNDKEVIIRLYACGICGSDIHMYETDKDGYMIWPSHIRLPVIPGHEFSGEVVEVGKEVTKFQVGDLVTAEEPDTCGFCFACQMGYRCQCEEMLAGKSADRGFTDSGGMAECIAIKEQYCWKLDTVLEAYDGDREATLEAGALTEPFSVAYEALFKRAGGIHPGGHVAVFGAGTIGLASIQLMHTSGAAKIFAIDPVKERRDLAKKIGADYVVDPTESSASEAILDITKGEGAAMLVEAAGAFLKTFPEMEKCMRVGAKLVIIGMAATFLPK